MENQISFTKMHGLGNDFIVLDSLKNQLPPVPPEQVRRICERRFGVGADQVLLLLPPRDPEHDAYMKIWNSDGSRAKMCGNGIRAVGLYLHRLDSKKTAFSISTDAGTKVVTKEGEDWIVDMGVPHLKAGFPKEGEYINIEGESLRYFEVDMGNPHAVLYLDSEAQDILRSVGEGLGPQISEYPRFKNGTNVEFVIVESPHLLRVCVWERGAGLTLACGTGACAAAVASIATGRAASPLEVKLPGGTLKIQWEGPGKSVFLQGPAEWVFEGQL